MEFIWKLIKCFIVIAYTLHFVTPDMQIEVDCMRKTKPYCCQTKCTWKGKADEKFDTASCTVKGEKMECFINDTDRKWETTPPSTPKGAINSKAKCHILGKDGVYDVSCYEDNKPICCETPCEWDLNFLNATCEMKKTEIKCKHRDGDNLKQVELCFQNTFCPHKPGDATCDFGGSDMCYIYTDSIDLKVQEQVSTGQIKDKEDKEDKTVTPGTCCTCYETCILIGFAIGFLSAAGISAGIVYVCLYKKCCRKRQGAAMSIPQTQVAAADNSLDDPQASTAGDIQLSTSDRGAAMSIPQTQDAAADNSLDDPQASGTQQIGSSPDAKYKLVPQDEKECQS